MNAASPAPVCQLARSHPSRDARRRFERHRRSVQLRPRPAGAHSPAGRRGRSATPPFISEAAKASLDRGETFYTAQRGVPELRAAIAAYMTRVYGAWPGGGAFSPENFFVTIGGMHAIEIATRLIVGPGDEALIPSPAWPKFVGALEISGARAVPVPHGGSGAGASTRKTGCGDHPRDAPHFSNLPRQPDRLRRHARGDRRDARHRAPAWAVRRRQARVAKRANPAYEIRRLVPEPTDRGRFEADAAINSGPPSAGPIRLSTNECGYEADFVLGCMMPEGAP